MVLAQVPEVGPDPGGIWQVRAAAEECLQIPSVGGHGVGGQL